MRALVLGAALLLGACDPEITSGAYTCGPQAACPPDFVCDGETITCVLPDEALPFSCGEPGDPTEPDDTEATARALGEAGCSLETIAFEACLPEGDADFYRITGACNGELEVQVRYLEAYAPVAATLRDDTGATVATGASCGAQRLCLEAEVTSGAALTLEVGLAGGDDCAGSCAFNRYQVSIF